jgi:hypothetical protein
MAIVDQKAVEKEWNVRGFSCALWIDAPGRVWRDFVHETDELVMLIEGEEEFEMTVKYIGWKSAKSFVSPPAPIIPPAMSAGAHRNGCTATSGCNSRHSGTNRCPEASRLGGLRSCAIAQLRNREPDTA